MLDEEFEEKEIPRAPKIFSELDFKELGTGIFQTCNDSIGSIDASVDFDDTDVLSSRIAEEYCHQREDCLPEEVEYNGEPFIELSKTMANVDKEGLVKKLVMKEGLEPLSAGATVTIEYKLYLEGASEPFDSTTRQGRPLIANVHANIIPGLWLAVESMQMGEKARFIINWKLAYGDGCMYRIPKRVDILADIEVLEIILSPSKGALEPSCEKLDKAKFLKEEGNCDFKEGDLAQSISKYNKALMILKKGRTDGDNEESEMIMRLHLNLAVAHNGSNNPTQALVHCDEVLRFDPKNSKALFHSGRAHFLLKNFVEANEKLLIGQMHYPRCEDFAKELRELHATVADLRRNSKIAKKMESLNIAMP